MTKIIIKNKNGLNQEFVGQPGASLLAQMEGQGLEIASSCRRGKCGLCMCKLLSGKEHLQAIHPTAIANGQMVFTCAVTTKSGIDDGVVEIEV